VGYHARVYTAQEIAATQHVPGKEVAKVVRVKADGMKIQYSDYARLVNPRWAISACTSKRIRLRLRLRGHTS